MQWKSVVCCCTFFVNEYNFGKRRASLLAEISISELNDEHAEDEGYYIKIDCLKHINLQELKQQQQQKQQQHPSRAVAGFWPPLDSSSTPSRTPPLPPLPRGPIISFATPTSTPINTPMTSDRKSATPTPTTLDRRRRRRRWRRRRRRCTVVWNKQE